jgi:hypothetical protein
MDSVSGLGIVSLNPQDVVVWRSITAKWTGLNLGHWLSITPPKVSAVRVNLSNERTLFLR